jgi:hypothetical protein
LPSTRTPGIPAAVPLAANDSAAVCSEVGVEIAQPLLMHAMTSGTFRTPARFIAS